ncbi:MAG TPA: S1/P1 Nuclease [Caulobacteraceae bacterium]|nr:S1/P1 Nuclease [Caulobacteraceae bacterium]
MISHRLARPAILACALLSLTSPPRALAWGATGHRLIGQAAAMALPADLPPFLRTPRAVEDLGELAREPDRWKASGKTHDTTRDPGHFVNIDDGGRVFGGPALNALPQTRSEYDAALRAVGSDSFHAGYLPYSIIDGWQQLTTDFAYWRVLTAAVPRERDSVRKAWLQHDLERREALILSDLGDWSHYVGDGSQPLHVSVHFNGWGAYPNPHGFTQDRIHTPYEGDFVRREVTLDAVRAAMPPLRPCAAIEVCMADYLARTAASVVPFYEMQKAGGLGGPNPAGRAFTVERVAAGAAELRDLTVAAWKASARSSIGYPAISVEAVVDGGVDPYDALYGED